MNPPGLFDGSFAHQNASGYGGDRLGEHPACFQWQRGQPGQDVTFYTDQCLEIVLEQIQLGIPGRKVAWLIEPPSLQDNHYIRAANLEDAFDYILTFNSRLLDRGEKWLYYPCGGSWIAPEHWGMQHKTKSISLIVSEKTKAPGHKLRREILERYGDRLDVYGRGVRPVASKVEALRDYRYSIIVESVRLDGYFSEKLIDCISQGTTPIYWGDPAIGDHFDLGGMLRFETLADLDRILDEIGRRNVYAAAYPGMVDNLITAREYACAEEWIAEHYAFLFGREK